MNTKKQNRARRNKKSWPELRPENHTHEHIKINVERKSMYINQQNIRRNQSEENYPYRNEIKNRKDREPYM